MACRQHLLVSLPNVARECVIGRATLDTNVDTIILWQYRVGGEMPVSEECHCLDIAGSGTYRHANQSLASRRIRIGFTFHNPQSLLGVVKAIPFLLSRDNGRPGVCRTMTTDMR